MLNRNLLGICISIVVALISYLFFWNRFVAFVIGQTIRILFWNQEGPSIWIDIGSIHFSLLAGRILLKDVKYHSSNQTIKVVKGQIQWRYWIRRPTSDDEIYPPRGENGKQSFRLLSCRIQLTFEGVEWFLYNRTAAYDSILEQIEKASRPTSRSSSHHRLFRRFSRQGDTSILYPPSAIRSSIRVPNSFKRACNWVRDQLPTLDPKDLLPLGIDIRTGAIILGNSSTPNLLVSEFQSASGTFGIVPSRSKYDLYKQVLNLKFRKSSMKLVHNDEYVDPMTIIGSLVHGRLSHYSTLRKPYFYQPYRAFMKIWRQMKLYDIIGEYIYTRRIQRLNFPPPLRPSPKLKKTADEDTPVGIDFSTFEYAIERKILEAPVLEITYYVDVVGEVPSRPVIAHAEGDGVYDIHNGDPPPEWGFDVIIYGGLLRYGPWADRQRMELQRAFFPPTYLDSTVTPALKSGDKRMWESLQIFIELRDATILHVPFREASKDWQWDGKVDISQRPRVREAASIIVDVGDRSSINYVMPMVVGPSGYESTFEVHLDTVAITSSLNDIHIIAAESCRVRGELPTPIRWDAERTWSIAVHIRQSVLFLLRDHINMFTDLAKDWASGPPTEYQNFIPMIYKIQLELHHYVLNLYANDQNIVDKPLIKEENALLRFSGPHLKNETTIPSNTFRPESTSIPFLVTAPNPVVNFLLPRWNTHARYASKEGINLLKATLLNVSGSYRYFSNIAEDHVEQLRLRFDLDGAVFRAYGWSIRYFMVLRDNYLGSFTHFQTLSEYLDKRSKNAPVGDPVVQKYRPGKANMLQVELSLQSDGSNILLPFELIGDATQKLTGLVAQEQGSEYLTLQVPEIQLQLRLHDYYMEMSLNIETITGIVRPPQFLLNATESNRIIVIDGIDITANRLFGPQPRTATYVCIWEIAVGKIKAFLTADDANMLAAAASSFRLNFIDPANAPANNFLPVVDPDVTFYKVTVKPIELTWKTGHAVLFVQLLQGLFFDSNDLGAHQYRKVSSLRIPRLNTSVLLASSTERKNQWLEAANISLDTNIDIYSLPMGHRAMTRKQLAFIEEQDKMTGRAKIMFRQLRQRTKGGNVADHFLHRNGVFLPQPSLPDTVIDSATFGPNLKTQAYRVRPPSWRLSTLANLSDSEEDEGISEVDRDARLARTRTSTPVPESRGDDMTMSSGDESDDADLTDGDSAGDNWSDLEDTNEQGTASMLKFYSPIVRHYCTNWPQSSKTWDVAAFSPTRNCAAFLNNPSNDDYESFSDASGPYTLLDEVPKDGDITTLRIRFRKPVEAVLTPLLIPAATSFEEDIKNMKLRHDMVIDSLLVDCLGQVEKQSTVGYQVVDLQISSLTVRALQHIGMLDGGVLDRNRAREVVTPRSLDITAVLMFGLCGGHFTGTFGNQIPVIKAKIDHTTATLDVSIDKRTLDSSLIDSTIFALAVSTFVVKMSQSDLRSNLGTIDVRLGNRGPEMITAAVTALTLTGMHILHQAEGLKLHRTSNKSAVIGSLLKVTEKHPVIDSLSTIQPSYLVQSGTPHALRTDATFRFLYHLQNTLWSLNKDEHDSLRQSSTIPMSDLLALVGSRLGLLDQDASSIDHLSSITYLLSDETQTTEQKKRIDYSFDTMALQVDTSTVTILSPTGKMSSRLNIDNMVLDVQSKSLDLVQFNFNNSSSASQTSLRSKTAKTVRKTVLLFSVNDITLIVSPNLMYFAQHVLRVMRQVKSSQVDAPMPRYGRGSLDKSANLSSKVWYLEVITIVQRLRIQAGAENLILVMGIHELHTSSTMLAPNKRVFQAMNHGVLFDQVYFQARSPADPAKETDQDILAALAFTTGRISVIAKPETESTDNLKVVFALAGLQLYVPRSALRLYHFVGEWRADYLPGMEAAVKTLLSEYNAGPTRPSSPSASRLSSRKPMVQIHGQVSHFEISLQVMHGTWLSWEVNKTIAYLNSSVARKDGGQYAFGLQIASIIFSISSKPNVRDVTPSSRVKLVLPPVLLAGNIDGFNVHTLILFEFIELKVKPSHWDTLLSVQQKFGQDFNDLVALMQQTREKGVSPGSIKPTSRKMPLQYEAHLKMQGFRIGLEGVASTVLLECQNISGEISNTKGWSWGLDLSDLALSLAPRARGRRDAAFNRDQRSAFVIIDFKFNGSGSEIDSAKTLTLSVSKMHAVMQPSSIVKLGDFIDNLQIEMLERQDQRALELATFKEKTQSILKTFDVNIGDVQTENISWIHTLIVNISIKCVGVAFPLIYDEELAFAHTVGKESNPIRAFLFSMNSVEFGIHRGESGQAVMQYLSFQFISRFRQSVPEDFSAENHRTLNRLLYPKMTAQLRSTYTGTSTKIWVDANVSGFIFDIDSTIPKFIFSLIDVYRQGKERVERLAANVPRTPLTSTPLTTEPKLPSPEKHDKTIPASNISASLIFNSGKVRLYSGSASNLLKTKTMSMPLELSDEKVSEYGAEIFKLPIVSVWTEYRATPISQKSIKGSDPEPSVLIFNSTVHSSNNTLRPILLPFLTELVNHIESRMRKVSFRTPKPPSTLLPLSSSNDSLSRIEEEESISSLQICFSLRIDRSKLELTCQPDVNVVAGLHWESGGFVINMTPGARKVSFFGSVGGLTIGLKHGFLSEDCVKLDARDLAFSVSLQRLDSEFGHSISIVLDTEILGGVRFSRLQDILCFKAVWLDRIPLFNQASLDVKTRASPRSTADETVDSSTLQGRMSTMVLVRIRKIKLEVDLGQSISKIGLELADSVLGMNLNDDLNEVFLFIGDVSMNAKGNLSGRAQVSSCVFQTIRRSESGLWNRNGRGKMLELKLTSGSLVVSLESDHQQLLHYRAQPLEVEVFDDWSRMQPQAKDAARPLQLSFTVICPEVVAAVTLGTIPKLLSHANKFRANLDAQRQGAFRESQTFRATRAPKPNNPLSAVAEAMLLSAKSRFKESDTGLSYIIRQHMSLRLDMLRLIVFPRTMKDVEIAQFIARGVKARLNGLVGTDLVSGGRDLRLSFSSMVISRYTQVTHSTSVPLDSVSSKEQEESQWPNSLFKDATEAIIVGLPSMKMHMISEEITEESDKTLTYDFYSEFVRRAGMKAFEDIYITLNMSLYSWLTILRKNLTRELDQVRATEDWRTSISNVSTAMNPVVSSRKKKVPDPLSITESPRSATLPSAGTSGLSPYGPPSVRQGWLDQSRSPQSAREQFLSLAPSPLHSASTTMQFPVTKETAEDITTSQTQKKRSAITYKPRERRIERLTMRQLGEATPDVMHPFFMKKAGFNLEDSLPQYVNEYAIAPLEEMMEVLLKLYSQQLLAGTKRPPFVD